MSAIIDDLWAEDIEVNVLTPLAILRAQEGPLERKTRGILKATVLTVSGEGSRIQHQSDLIAPVLGYGETLLTAEHSENVYPVEVTAKCFTDTPKALRSFEAPAPGEREDTLVASTDTEFTGLVREVLRSRYVRSLMQSLIARSNEIQRSTEPSEQTEDDAKE